MNIQDELQVNVSEAVSVGASFSLPVPEDQDVGVNGRLEYQLLPVDGGVFRLVHSVSVSPTAPPTSSWYSTHRSTANRCDHR